MASEIRVLLADDQAMLREALTAIIEHQPDMQVVGAAADGRAAVDAAHALQPDVLVTDLSMPVLDGFGAIAQLRADGLATHTVVWTARSDRTAVNAVQVAGGLGYVLKHSPVEVLLEAIRIAAAGLQFCDPALSEAAAPPDVSPIPDSSPGLLSAEELLVLQYTARGHTTQEIAQALGGDPPTIAELRRRAMALLGLPSRIALVRYAARQGWLDASWD